MISIATMVANTISGGYTALSTKGVASLLSNTIWRVFTTPVTYLLVAILVFTAIMQIKYINRALQRFDSTQVIPTQFVMFTISVIVGSAILYRDFERKTAEDAAKFFAGCALTFLGVWCITSGRSRGRGSDEEGDSSDEEDGIHLHDEDAGDTTPTKHQDVRALGSAFKPNAPQRTTSTKSDGPILRITTSSEEQHPSNPIESILENPWTGSKAPPATTSAIHHPPSQIRTSPTKSRKPPPMHATTSEPILPTSAFPAYEDSSSSHLRAPDMTSPLLRSATNDRPRTPENNPASPLAEPSSVTTPRFGSIGRHSFVDILPHMGPLTNPLSNSLSAIVADSLRKGGDFRPGASLRRRSLRSKRSRTRFLEEGGLGFTAIQDGNEEGQQLGSSLGQSYGEGSSFGGMLRRGESREEGARH
jgi:magnesium transporter